MFSWRDTGSSPVYIPNLGAVGRVACGGALPNFYLFINQINNKTMRKFSSPYLVQRLKKPLGQSNPFAFGGGYKNGGLSEKAMDLLKNIFRFDYMGSAEFEWGAVPKAFQRLAEEQANLVTETEGKVFILCPKEYVNEVKAWVKLASIGEEGNLKESLGLQRALNKEKYADTLGWLCIDENQPFMFFVDETMFKDTCKLFGVETEEYVHSGGSTHEGEE